MFHFLKFIILVLFLFIILNFFRSNLDTAISLKFQIPFVLEWASEPLPVNFMALALFCLGILFAALVGAFRMGAIRREKKRLKELHQVPLVATNPGELPSLME